MSSISICAVIPTLNEEEHVAQCIAELKNQSVSQIIVADGGSDDRTIEIARELGVEVASSQRGRGHQLQAAIDHTDCDLIWMIHADCIPPTMAVQAIGQSVTAGARWGAFMIEHVVPVAASKRMTWCLRMANKRSRTTSLPYGDQAIFVQRELLIQIGGVPKQGLMEDLELSIRLNKVAPPLIIENRVSVNPRRFIRRPITTFIAWMLFPLLYRFGVSPQRLMRWYG